MAKGHLLAFFFLVCLEVFAAQAADLSVTIQEASPARAKLGSNITLTCAVNSLEVLLTNDIVWVKEPRVAELNTGTVQISRKNKLVVGAPLSSRYSVTVQDKGSPVISALTIRDVQDVDDGRFVCKVVGISNDKEVNRGQIDVIVPHSAESMQMILYKGNRTSMSPLTEGSYLVHCLVKRFNPGEETIVLMLDGGRVAESNHTSFLGAASTAAGAPRYSIQVQAVIHISQEDDGKNLTCSTVTPRYAVTLPLRVGNGGEGGEGDGDHGEGDGDEKGNNNNDNDGDHEETTDHDHEHGDGDNDGTGKEDAKGNNSNGASGVRCVRQVMGNLAVPVLLMMLTTCLQA